MILLKELSRFSIRAGIKTRTGLKFSLLKENLNFLFWITTPPPFPSWIKITFSKAPEWSLILGNTDHIFRMWVACSHLVNIPWLYIIYGWNTSSSKSSVTCVAGAREWWAEERTWRTRYSFFHAPFFPVPITSKRLLHRLKQML